MHRILALVVLASLPCYAQTTTTGKATTTGPCSPANSGNKNTFIIHCGIGQEQGREMLDIVNKVLANQLDPKAVMKKLDEILKAVNPNLPVKTYSCNGTWRTVGPSADAVLDVRTGGDASAYREMLRLLDAGSNIEALNLCQAQISSAPGWLTPYLVCGIAYQRTGNTVRAKEMLATFDSNTGPAYDVDACPLMSRDLHRALE